LVFSKLTRNAAEFRRQFLLVNKMRERQILNWYPKVGSHWRITSHAIFFEEIMAGARLLSYGCQEWASCSSQIRIESGPAVVARKAA